MRRWIGRTVAGAVIAGGLLLLAYGYMPKPVPVEVARARRGPFQSTLVEDGLTRVRDRFIVQAPLAGLAERIALRPGAAVQEGAILTRIWPMPSPLLDVRARLEAEARVAAAADGYRQAQAATARAAGARDLAERELERARSLVAQAAMTRQALERAASELNARTAELDSARFAEQVAAHQLQDARAVLAPQRRKEPAAPFPVAAPTGGLVLRVPHESEGPVSPGMPLAELGDLASLEVIADVLTRDAVQLRPGMRAVVDRWGGERALGGQVLRVEPSAFTKVSPLGTEEQRVNAVVALDAPPAERPDLGDGFEVEVRFVTWEASGVLSVPASAVFRSGDGWGTFVVRGGRARLTPIALGHRSPLEVEVARGLSENDAVIVHPGDAVREGVRVKPSAVRE